MPRIKMPIESNWLTFFTHSSAFFSFFFLVSSYLDSEKNEWKLRKSLTFFFWLEFYVGQLCSSASVWFIEKRRSCVITFPFTVKSLFRSVRSFRFLLGYCQTLLPLTAFFPVLLNGYIMRRYYETIRFGLPNEMDIAWV